MWLSALVAELLLKMIIEAEIGKRIRQYRLRNNFTLQELADKTGFSKGYLSKVEKSGKALKDTPLDTLEHYWQEAKRRTAAGKLDTNS